jgi:hypothetical protein
LAIYRGPGGPGDAVNDAASEVLLALAAKDAAIAAQVAAEVAQAAAEAAQTAAELAETNAETAETNAETAETNAAASASAAATSATNASNSASAASTSATNASNSASAASTSASNAATSETNASNSASSASTSATNASNSASSASTSATNAANSATAAANSATAAANSATLAASYTPSQTGNAGKYLKTDGTNTSWDAIDINTADITGTLPIANGGTGQTTVNAAFNALVPSQTSNSGKYLTTDGTNTSWATVSGSISVTGGDLTMSGNTGTSITNATLATVNNNTGSFGGSTSIPVITVNGKGLITAVSTATVAGGQYFGSATTKAIAYNSQTIAENVTVTTGNNGLSAGPVTINSSYTVTIESGANWVIV